MFLSNFCPPEDGGSGFENPYLASLAYVQASEQPDWSFYMHTHARAHEISYVLDGRGALYCGGKYYELVPGTVVIKVPGVQHAESSDPQRPIEQIAMLVENLQAKDRSDMHFLREKTLIPILPVQDHRPLMDALAREMIGSIIGKEHPDLAFSNSLLQTMLYVITDELKKSASLWQTDSHGKLMEEIRIWLDSHYMENVSLEAIAERFHLSVYYLARQFKKYTGLTVNNYLISCRMGEAQRRLIFTGERIDTIALQCGYSNLSYFYTTFRKKAGCTPSDYRRTYGR